MIVGSVLLVIAAGVLLGFGLVRLNEPLLYSSIGVSALAALTLVVGLRRLSTVRAGRGVIAVRLVPAQRPSPRPIGRATPRPVGRAKVALPTPVDGVAPADLEALAEADPTVPADEPAAEAVAGPELARVARLAAEVAVVDGRPRFHLLTCLHLLGLDTESLTTTEVLEFGFTPCGLCRPVTTLLRQAGVEDDAGGSSA